MAQLESDFNFAGPIENLSGYRMYMVKALCLCFVLAVNISARSQTHFRLYIENDFFAFKSPGDKYYTNGIKFEWISPRYKIPFLEKIFPGVDQPSSTNYALALGQNMYTASDIRNSEIMPHDRPYAAWLYVGFRKFSNSISTSTRITSELSVGVIGPAALGEPVQKTFHEIIGSAEPMGWDHQIRNNPGVNYSIEIENQLYNSENQHMDMIWFTNVDVGTVFDNFGVGTLVRISPFRVLSSYFESTFSKQTTIRKRREGIEGDDEDLQLYKEEVFEGAEKKKLSMYFFVKPSVKFVAYNALLQGGIFNGRDNPRSVSPNELERMYLNFDIGVVFPLGYRFDVVFGQSFRTAEFRNAPVHYWGFLNVIYNGKNYYVKRLSENGK